MSDGEKSNKKSLRIPIHVCGWCIFALVATDATSCFIQFSLAKKLGIWDKNIKSTHQIRYANGVVEPVLGIIPLEITLQVHYTTVPAYVLHGKGPALILGFTFLE